jgi:leucyl/phenylalanyl-tRNA--protein transferase
MAAYRAGIFPWYTEGQPVLWWSPNPRAVLFPDRIKVSRSLRKTLRKDTFRVTMDRAFQSVIRACAAPRGEREGTWITPAMAAAYTHLHITGRAHSVEVWQGEQLVGGLYGVALGRAFFGESMFSRVSDASKVALVHLAGQLRQWGYGIIDCQVESAHLARLGAESIPRREFLRLLDALCDLPGQPAPWRMDEPAPIEFALRREGTRS